MRFLIVSFVVFVVACFAASCTGPMGPEGPTGLTGPTGPQGDPGIETEIYMGDITNNNYGQVNTIWILVIGFETFLPNDIAFIQFRVNSNAPWIDASYINYDLDYPVAGPTWSHPVSDPSAGMVTFIDHEQALLGMEYRIYVIRQAGTL